MWHGGASDEAVCDNECRTGRCTLAGWGVGILIGCLGVGGGFLLVPALRRYAHQTMKLATGTSLGIIAFNSVAGTPIPWHSIWAGSPALPGPDYLVDVALGSMTQSASIAPEALLSARSPNFTPLANENNVRLSFRTSEPAGEHIVLASADAAAPELSTFLLLGAGLGAICLRGQR